MDFKLNRPDMRLILTTGMPSRFQGRDGAEVCARILQWKFNLGEINDALLQIFNGEWLA